MTTKTPHHQTPARGLIARTGRGLREVWHDVATADRLMTERRVDQRLHNPF